MMKAFAILLLSLVTGVAVAAPRLYSKAYGSSKHKPVIFLHGGPGGNATLFEATTAERLAGQGYFVIVYDRRGEGRSADPQALFTYQEAFDDLNAIYTQYGIKKATLIGHSFGGLVATLYARQYPGHVHTLILAGALFSQQETYDHILQSVRQMASDKKDTASLRLIGEVAQMDKQSAAYRKGCYDLAGRYGFFSMPTPTKAAKQLRRSYEGGVLYQQNIRSANGPLLFYKNEPLKNIDTKAALGELKEKGMPLYAVYGKQDAIFSARQMAEMKAIAGPGRFVQIDNCSHYLFVDQQRAFIDCITKWMH